MRGTRHTHEQCDGHVDLKERKGSSICVSAFPGRESTEKVIGYPPKVYVTEYGPRGGYVVALSVSPAEARSLAVLLTSAADKLLDEAKGKRKPRAAGLEAPEADTLANMAAMRK